MQKTVDRDRSVAAGSLLSFECADRSIVAVSQSAEAFFPFGPLDQDICNRAIGVSPKWLIRCLRLQDALARRDAGANLNLAALAHGLGCFEQAHFTRDFGERIANVSPGRYDADFADLYKRCERPDGKVRARMTRMKDRTQSVLTFTTVHDLEAYLSSEPVDSRGFWLKVSKIGAPESTIGKAEAIEAALCCGWIDGQLRKLDEHYFLVRMTPRRPGSRWSANNRATAERLALHIPLQARRAGADRGGEE